MCQSFGVNVYEEPYTVQELMAADEIVVTSSGTLCRPVCMIDGIPVGGKAPELLRKLQDALMKDFIDKTDI